MGGRQQKEYSALVGGGNKSYFELLYKAKGFSQSGPPDQEYFAGHLSSSISLSSVFVVAPGNIDFDECEKAL